MREIDYDLLRNLRKAAVADLSDCQWIANDSNLIITSATGVAKTYLMSAFGRKACTKSYSVKSYWVTRLLTDLIIGKGDGSYNKLMKDLVKPDLLILNDFGMKQLDLGLTQDFLEVIEENHQKSVALLTQLPVKEWISVLKDLTVRKRFWTGSCSIRTALISKGHPEGR